MRSSRLYFLLPVFFIGGCKNPTEPASQQPPPLFPEPLSFLLDTARGYQVNPFTGDSIKEHNATHGKFITGVTCPLNSSLYDQGLRSAVIPGNKFTVVRKTAKNNISFPVPKPVGLRLDSFQLQTGLSIPLSFPAIENTVRMPQPALVKALPFRYKEGAEADIQYLDVDQGLISSYIFSLLKDSRGYFWFGTDDAGLMRFDGTHLNRYTVKEGLSGDNIYCLTEDSKGSIWLGTSNGINKLNGTSISSFSGGPPFKKVFSIMEDDSKSLWLSTDNGLVKFKNNEFLKYTRKNGLPSDSIFKTVQDKRGDIWIVTPLGLAKLTGNQIYNYRFSDNKEEYIARSMIIDSLGVYWLGTYQGLVQMDKNKLNLWTIPSNLSSAYIWNLVADSQNTIWIGTAKGLVHFDGKKMTEYGTREGLNYKKVRSILEDEQGNIWFGTDGGGVNRLKPHGFTYPLPPELLNSEKVRPVIIDNNGDLVFSTELGNFGKFSINKQVSQRKELTVFQPDISRAINGQRALLMDKNNTIWLGCDEKGLNSWNGKNFTRYFSDHLIFPETFFSLHEDRNKHLWVGSDIRGLFKFDGNHLFHFALPSFPVFSIAEDSIGNKWLGTKGGGLIKVNPGEDKYIVYGEKQGFFGKNVTNIVIDKKGLLWISTSDNGLCCFDGKLFTYFTQKEGLSNNAIWSLLVDERNNIWAGTDLGLNRLIPAIGNTAFSEIKYSIYNYGLQDGLKGIDFSLHGACADSLGNLWWGNGKGIVSRNNSLPFRATGNMHLKLVSIEINDQAKDFTDPNDSLKNGIRYSTLIPFTNCPIKPQMSYDRNNIRFHFSATDWAAPSTVKYSFRMIGLNDNWTNPAEEPFADYRNMNPGEYEFQVAAIGSSQTWTKPYAYAFTIVPAWWQTWWFKSIVVLISIFILLFISRLVYLEKLKRQRLILEKQIAVQYERQRIAAEMHDDIGAGLSGIRLLTEMTKNKIDNEQSAIEVNKIYDSLGDISSKMKEVIWSLNTENDSLINLITYLQKQFRAWLEHYPAQQQVSIPDQIPDRIIPGEIRRNIFLIVKEAIHNIIKHSQASKVELAINSDGQKLFITIADNGKGIEGESGKDGGNGMKNIKQRLEKLNGNLSVINKNGLSLYFEIPI